MFEEGVGKKTKGSTTSKELEPRKQDLQASNPFKMDIKEMSNPWKINLQGNNENDLFFGNQQAQRQSKLFPSIKNQKNFDPVQTAFIPKFTRMQSKAQSTHSQQNIKRYKDVLRFFYNNKYIEKVKTFGDYVKKSKKETSTTPSLSQELRKPEGCFKATRLVFNKENKLKSNNYQKLEENYLAAYLKASKQLRIYQLKEPNLKSMKPITVVINEVEVASSIEYDQTYGRIFYFSNACQQIVVVGVKSKEVICRVKVKYRRNNPCLYIFKYKTSLYLLVTGGYRMLSQSVVEGSKYIEIFSIDKWEISLKQVVLRLGIGRISPIIFSCDHESEPRIFIIGGYSNAAINKRKELSFKIDEDINYSTNQTGLMIDPSFIEDCFLGDQSNPLLINNINVRFDNPLQLYGGSVLFRKLPRMQKLQLFLPKNRAIFTVRTLKNDVHIIRSEIAMDYCLVAQEDGAINNTIGYHRDQNNQFQLYRVDFNGSLNSLKVHISENKDKSKNYFQPRCQIM